MGNDGGKYSACEKEMFLHVYTACQETLNRLFISVFLSSIGVFMAPGAKERISP